MANAPIQPGATFKTLGYAGLPRFSGYIFDEFLPELQGPRGRRTIREMADNSPVIGAFLFGAQMLIRQVGWHVDPDPGLADDDDGRAAFINDCLNDMATTWPDRLSEILTFLPFGWAFHELVYKRRDGINSRFADGKIGWYDWPLRGQETLLRWEFDDDGNVLGMVQLGPPSYQEVVIPMEKALLFRTSVARGNPEGRALDPTTPIPTPHGWKALDALHPGDSVFDDMGRIRYITARADWEDRPCYRLTFNDGSSIVADENHEWPTRTASERSARAEGGIRTTAEIAATIKHKGHSNHSLAWCKPLDYPAQTLPLDPYVFGLWLGDGYSRAMQIACHADDAAETAELIGAAGYGTATHDNGPKGSLGRSIRVYGDGKWDARGPSAALRVMGVIMNKHIPQSYLRGSIDQRRALLAGLMDSDGTVDGCGRCEFANTNRALIDGVAELVRSLGCGVTIRTRKPAGNGHGWQTAWLVKFTPDWSPFRLVRKSARILGQHARRQTYIVSSEPVAPRRTVCIEVDGPSHLFLAGEAMVPTHNSILRNAYTSFYFRKHIEIFQGIGIERDLAGIPYLRIPGSILAAQNNPKASPEELAALQGYQNLAMSIKVDENQGIILPSDVDPDTKTPLYTFDLVHSSGSKQFNAMNIMHEYDVLMAQTVLADFIQLGHQAVGSKALAESKTEMFTAGLRAWLYSVSSVVNDVAIPRLLRLNGMSTDRIPTLHHGEIEREDIQSLGQYVLALAQAGFQLDTRYDSNLTKDLLEKGRMPDPPDDAPPMLNLPSVTAPQPAASPPTDDPADEPADTGADS